MLWNQLNILEAHPGVWEMEEQGEFYVWGTGISNFFQGNKETAPHPQPNPGRVCGEMNWTNPGRQIKLGAQW